MYRLRHITPLDPRFQDEVEACNVQPRINRVYQYLVSLGFEPPAHATIDFQTRSQLCEIDVTSWTPVVLRAETFNVQTKPWVVFAYVR